MKRNRDPCIEMFLVFIILFPKRYRNLRPFVLPMMRCWYSSGAVRSLHFGRDDMFIQLLAEYPAACSGECFFMSFRAELRNPCVCFFYGTNFIGFLSGP